MFGCVWSSKFKIWIFHIEGVRRLTGCWSPHPRPATCPKKLSNLECRGHPQFGWLMICWSGGFKSKWILTLWLLVPSYGNGRFRWSMMIYTQIYPWKTVIFPAVAPERPDQVAVFDMHEDICARSNVLEAARHDVPQKTRRQKHVPSCFDSTLTLVATNHGSIFDYQFFILSK